MHFQYTQLLKSLPHTNLFIRISQPNTKVFFLIRSLLLLITNFCFYHLTKSSVYISNSKLNNFPEQYQTSFRNNSFICTFRLSQNKTNSSSFSHAVASISLLFMFFGPLRTEMTFSPNFLLQTF